MPRFQVPLRDMQFTLLQALDGEAHYASLPAEESLTPDLISAIFEEGARFAEDVVAPLNRVGDVEGCRFDQGEVKTPSGFRQAYQQYVEGGWPSLAHDPAYGGQGLPESLGMIMNEMISTASWAWSMYPGLSHGAMNTIETHGTDEQKAVYLTRLVSGEWTGTMCLTEAHCGTDLGLLKTRAEPEGDGSYRITGTKIFISAGEHDLAENIVHIVLARLPDAPQGTQGISLFIVPKFLPTSEGGIGVRNGLSCGSIEHKMGIHGNATCVLNFDGATGFLIGPANKGLNCMFTFMNTARLGTALQGLAHTEWAFQNSLDYARDRLQMRSLNGPVAPDQPADPIIVHPEVRKMLLTQKAFAEGGRALIYYCALLVDRSKLSTSPAAREKADSQLALLTPIAKAFLTEVGFESANHGLQVYGGHGYIAEWGMEQNVRDARIAMLYEGTTQIQALDLLGRKVLMTQGETLKSFTKVIHKFCQAHREHSALSEMVTELAALNTEWGELTLGIGMKAMQNRQEVGAASVDYLMYSGYITLAYLWARMAVEAHRQLKEGQGDGGFNQAKLATADFYYKRILPRTRSLAVMIQSGAEPIMALDAELFSREYG
ncbi:acyl-CoA dehydrogenase C-terminal domain-containing protein [Pokkaliibacter sp. CJK22405]|uniref:acyl-CoA dehydrogenase C-terminal domain-containing protein n=1 Tax=Pokkaliibacter sp. CJK22405 TaxID=3384615 RepID=UPI0039851002